MQLLERDRTQGRPPTGGAPARASRRWTVLSLLVLAALFALPLRGLLRLQGPPMEEGFMLVFPERVLEGDLPNRDFLHLYGPGSLWALAAAFWAFGVSLTVERLFGLLQLVGLVTGVWALARHWGRLTATVAASVCLLVILPPVGLTALAFVGALALGVWAVWAALRARGAPPASAGRWAFLAGVLAGLTLLFRPDLVVATGGAVAVALWGTDRRRLRGFAAGAAAGVAPYLVHFLTAGIGNSIRGMLLDPVVYLRGGRSLPIPPSPSKLVGFLQLSGETYLLGWPLPTPTTAQQIAVWFWLVFVAVAALLWVGLRRLRADRGSLAARTMVAVAVFSVGLLPTAVQRTDSTHFAWASAVSLGFLPVVVLEVLRARRALSARWRPLVAAGLVAALLLAVIPTFTFRRYADLSVQSFGRHRLSFEVTHDGRSFFYGRRDAAEAMEEMFPDVDRIAPPGGRLFVGTGDLRKTPYSDAFLYYLFPHLEPATRYIEMDPGVANREDSGLAEDLASADVVILSRIWDDWDEPNDARELGSDEPNRVLRRLFRRVGVYGDEFELYELWERRTPRGR